MKRQPAPHVSASCRCRSMPDVSFCRCAEERNDGPVEWFMVSASLQDRQRTDFRTGNVRQQQEASSAPSARRQSTPGSIQMRISLSSISVYHRGCRQGVLCRTMRAQLRRLSRQQFGLAPSSAPRPLLLHNLAPQHREQPTVTSFRRVNLKLLTLIQSFLARRSRSDVSQRPARRNNRLAARHQA